MIINPGRSYEPVVTRHSRELSKRVEDVVRVYRSEHSDVSDEELRSALTMATRATAGEDTSLQKRRIMVAAAGFIVAIVGGALAASTRDGAPNQVAWLVFAGVAAAAGAAIAVVRMSRRF